jgi:hypothetical protein
MPFITKLYWAAIGALAFIEKPGTLAEAAASLERAAVIGKPPNDR